MECISLPEELVEQILYRVPIKSVARWRSTSKQWNALLKSKRFLKTHATYAPLFPEATTRSTLRPTYVLWDMSDYSVPENFDPCLVMHQIESSIEKEGYEIDGDFTIWVYGAEDTWSSELQNQFGEVGIEVHPYKGVKRTRLNMLIGEFIAMLYAMDEPSNVLMLSDNTEYIEQHPKFPKFRNALEEKGFAVALAHPDRLINRDADPSALMAAYLPSRDSTIAFQDVSASPLPLPPPPLPLPALPLPCN
ncbi:unnamed protein product [Microthlaspi erraticum]|uniref:F-box domain-containing protein n=1 Tax=Microthlaspi erraticum TaxID=1685480 RepID=A0A6D2IUY7_9BRAS|nr:unnamed protein product [Microthlaspi erraticum]